MAFFEASIPQGLSPKQRLEVVGTYMYSKCTTTALTLAWSLLGQKRTHDDLEDNQGQDTEMPTLESEVSPTSRNLRKRARVSYVEPTETEFESDADSGYNSDSSVEWGTTRQFKAKRPRKEKPVKPFPFLSLPTELRNKIYLLALEDPDGMVLNEGWRSHRRVPKRDTLLQYDDKSHYAGLGNLERPGPMSPHTAFRGKEDLRTLSPSLLAVNKQIYAEAVRILYSQPLHFANTAALHHFLAPLSSQTLSLVRDIIVHTYSTWGRGVRKAMNVSALTLLRGCSNLRLLRIETLGHHYHLYSRNYKKTVEDDGRSHGALLARQVYRDAAFWIDTVGASKALQVLDLPELRREIVRQKCWSQEAYDDDVEGLKFANMTFVEEFTYLVEGMGKGMKRSKKSYAKKSAAADNAAQTPT
ncbi:hypothetical protein D6D05_08615 [Aureobasidium pullulans]|nr:hypothetical protein D6D05_08615 [Aureobasidium pullulans]